MEKTKLISKGKRIDGRGLDEMRPFEVKAGILDRADGSASFRIGNTMAIAAVYGPREMHPRHNADPSRATLRCRYNMAPFSTTERVRPGPSRRSVEISKVIKGAFSNAIFLEEFPKAVIDVFIEIVEADASTRCAGINAAAVALADAGIPMKDLIASCSAGKIEDHIVLDVAGLEDMEGQVDIPIAYSPRTGQITLLQMDGIITPEEFKKALGMAIGGCEKINEAQRMALKDKFKAVSAEGDKV